MKRVAENTNIITDRRLTNTYVRKHLCQKLLENQVPGRHVDRQQLYYQLTTLPLKSDVTSHGGPTPSLMSTSFQGQVQKSTTMRPLLGTSVQSHGQVYQKAYEVLRQAGLNPDALLTAQDDNDTGMEEVPYATFPLPPLQPMENPQTDCAQKVVVVCQPNAVSEIILNDCFCRFGCLICVYTLPGKNYGYAKFSSYNSAKRAADYLNGETIGGQKLKVMLST